MSSDVQNSVTALSVIGRQSEVSLIRGFNSNPIPNPITEWP